MMDEENQIDDKLKRKRELTNARVKKHRKKKRIESQQLNSAKKNKKVKENKTMDEENQIDDKLKRKRELTNARVKKHRKKKRIESQQLNSAKKIKQVKERKRALAKERSRRYRERKRLNALKTLHRVVYDPQIPGPSQGNPPLEISNQRTTVNDSQIAGTSTNMNIPVVGRDDSGNLNRIRKKLLSPIKKEDQPGHVDDNLVPLNDQVKQLLIPMKKEYQPVYVHNNLVPFKIQNLLLPIKEEYSPVHVDNNLLPLEDPTQNLLSPIKEEYQPVHVEDNSVPLEDRTYKMDEENQIDDKLTERKRALAKEYSRRYREEKRLIVLKSAHHVDKDSQIPGPSHGNSTFVLNNQQTTIDDFQIAGTFKNINIPRVVCDNSENLNRIGENLFSPVKEEYQTVYVDDNLPLEDQVIKMDEENSSDGKSKRKKELTNARIKKFLKKKRNETPQLNSSMQNELQTAAKKIQNKQVKESNVEQKRAITKERSKRFREKKSVNVLKLLDIRMETD